MKSLLMVLALGGAAAAAPGPDFVAANPPRPVHPNLAASTEAKTAIDPTDVVTFSEASNVVLDAAQDQIDRAAAWLKAHPGYNIVLEGHTDEAGSPTYNEGLALARAESVGTRLQQHGIATDRIVLVAWGEEQATHPSNLNDRRVVMYATPIQGRAIASQSLRRGALRAAWYAGGSRFDMSSNQAL
jgi:outer membrane protein OmpA-like peptidoglycan-associated protein